MLLATIAHHGERHEFHGEPVSGRCLVTLLGAAGTRLDSRICEREATKDVIRALRDEYVPGSTLVFAYAGADPWPLYTQAGVPDMLELLAEAREALGLGPDGDDFPADFARQIRESAPVANPIRPTHPAADLLGEDER